MIMAIFLFWPKQLSDHSVISFTSEVGITLAAHLEIADAISSPHLPALLSSYIMQ